ncbi:MAG: InlB B-repeat-containing protein, partial [Spirochaetota bacterium]
MSSALRILALAVAGSLLLSCTIPTSEKTGLTGSLLVSVQHETRSRSILPEGIASVSFKATGSGPAGETLAPATSATGTFSFTSLSVGSWTVTVSGLDSAGGGVASGSATVTVGTGAAATAAVQLLPVSGTGTLQLSLSWPSGKQVDEVAGSITLDGGAASPITCTIKDNAATLSKDLAAGSYILIVNLKKAGALVAAPRMEVAGIYKGKTSSGSIALVAADFDAYFVSYDSNGATGGTPPTDSSNYQSGDSATVAGNTGSLAKAGYAFAGWNTKADGTGTSYAADAKVTMGAGSVGLFAAWTVQKFGIKGNIQKGPFSSGTSITIQALDANLDPLGTSYQTVTTDDFGAFALGSQITSRYVEIIAKGYYFNEIAGSLSPSELTLRAYTD